VVFLVEVKGMQTPSEEHGFVAEQIRMRFVPLWIDDWIEGTLRMILTHEERAIWLDLLCLAQKRWGYIRVAKGKPYPMSRLAEILSAPEELIERTIDKAIKHRLLKRLKNGTLKVVNWKKKQLPGLIELLEERSQRRGSKRRGGYRERGDKKREEKEPEKNKKRVRGESEEIVAVGGGTRGWGGKSAESAAGPKLYQAIRNAMERLERGEPIGPDNRGAKFVINGCQVLGHHRLLQMWKNAGKNPSRFVGLVWAEIHRCPCHASRSSDPNKGDNR